MAPSEIDEVWLSEAFERYMVQRTTALRDQIQAHADTLAFRSARRFADSGEPFDDLLQVARFGLFKAIERFDPSRGVPFPGFATPTILGELRRHFRDHTWSVHVPRRAKDLRPAVNEAIHTLTSELGTAPKVAQLAARLQVSEEAVIEALDANNAYRAYSLDPVQSAHLAAADENNDSFVDRDLVVSLLDRLPERQKTVLYLRFFEELTQAQIAERIGTSQVHVGRIIAASLERLRVIMENDPTALH